MRATVPDNMERGRDRTGDWASSSKHGFNGRFTVRSQAGAILTVIASTGGGWEHVSVSLRDRCPTWKEMCWVKDLCWEPEETVMQLHPPQSRWVDFHPYCLHLWKPSLREIPLPPSWMVGPRSVKVACQQRSTERLLRAEPSDPQE